MMKHEDMITLIGNMFINAYVAGDRKDLESFRSARADRDRMFDAVRDLYAELESESYQREQFEVELKNANHKIEGLQRDYDHMLEIKDRLLMVNRSKDAKLKELGYMEADVAATEWLKKHTNVFDDIPDDGHEFSEQDLPFPDVEEMAPAEDVEGSEE